MSEQQQHSIQRHGQQAGAEEQLRLQPARTEQAELDSLVDLLDQIDAVIDANPQGYVRSFVQRGGQ